LMASSVLTCALGTSSSDSNRINVENPTPDFFDSTLPDHLRIARAALI
jgi:hypothetical protein